MTEYPLKHLFINAQSLPFEAAFLIHEGQSAPVAEAKPEAEVEVPEVADENAEADVEAPEGADEVVEASTEAAEAADEIVDTDVEVPEATDESAEVEAEAPADLETPKDFSSWTSWGVEVYSDTMPHWLASEDMDYTFYAEMVMPDGLHLLGNITRDSGMEPDSTTKAGYRYSLRGTTQLGSLRED
jgi:hypothetical protein